MRWCPRGAHPLLDLLQHLYPAWWGWGLVMKSPHHIRSFQADAYITSAHTPFFLKKSINPPYSDSYGPSLLPLQSFNGRFNPLSLVYKEIMKALSPDNSQELCPIYASFLHHRLSSGTILWELIINARYDPTIVSLALVPAIACKARPRPKHRTAIGAAARAEQVAGHAAGFIAKR